MEQMDSITKHFGIKRYRSVAAVCAIYLDAQNVETHLYLKLTSFCVNNLTHISLWVLILVKSTVGLNIFYLNNHFYTVRTAISAHQVIISISVWYG